MLFSGGRGFYAKITFWKRLNMSRDTNNKLLIKIEECEKKLIELQNRLNDRKIKLTI